MSLEGCPLASVLIRRFCEPGACFTLVTLFKVIIVVKHAHSTKCVRNAVLSNIG